MNDKDCWLNAPPEDGGEALWLKSKSQQNRKLRFKLNPSPPLGNGKSPARPCVSPPMRHIASHTKQAGDA